MRYAVSWEYPGLPPGALCVECESIEAAMAVVRALLHAGDRQIAAITIRIVPQMAGI